MQVKVFFFREWLVFLGRGRFMFMLSGRMSIFLRFMVLVLEFLEGGAS